MTHVIIRFSSHRLQQMLFFVFELCCNSEIRWFIFTFQKRKKTWSSRWRCTGDTWVSSRVPCCSLSPSPGWTRSLSATPMPCASGRNRNHHAKVKAPIPPKPNAKTVNPNRPRLRFTSTETFSPRTRGIGPPFSSVHCQWGICVSLLYHDMNRNNFSMEKTEKPLDLPKTIK